MVTSYKLGPFLGRVILPNLVAHVKQYRHTFPKFWTLGAPLQLRLGVKTVLAPVTKISHFMMRRFSF